MMHFFKLIICVMGVLLIHGTQTNANSVVRATLYSEKGLAGETFYTEDYIADLVNQNFGAQTQSVCATGLWFLFERDDFDSGGIGDYMYVVGEDQCQDLPDNLAQNILSVRQVGSPAIIDRPTLTLYGYNYFKGAELYLTKDWDNLGLFRDQSYSAIVTGPESWTVFTYENFGGAGTCLIPNETSTIAGIEFQYGFFPTYHELGSSGSIRSAKMGCA